MMYPEKHVLKAAADLTAGQPGEQGLQARELHRHMSSQGLRLDEVAMSLLMLRDHGLVVTEPTHGDPLDGQFRFRVTPAGREMAGHIRETVDSRLRKNTPG